MKVWACAGVLILISASTAWATPVWEGDWSRIRRYGHGQERKLFTAAQLAFIDDHIAYLTTEKIHGSDVFPGGNLDQAAMYTADQLQNTKVLLYLQAYYAFGGKWQAVVAEDYSNTNLFIYDGGMTDYAFNQGTVEGREFWACISDNVVNTSKVVGTFVDGIGKISTHGHSEWLPEFYQTLSRLDGLTIYNGPPGDPLGYSEGSMREDFVEGDANNMRSYLDLFLQVPDEKYMMLNSFNPNYRFALAGFLIVAHDKSFLRLYPMASGFNWLDVMWDCEEYHKPLGPPKGKGVRINDWIYERSFEYADVWLDLQTTNSVIAWRPAPVAHWTMNDGSGSVVRDLSGNGFDGTLTGGVWVGGRDRGALEFNGSVSPDTVHLPTNLFNRVANAVTIAMWVKGDAAMQPRQDSVFYAADASGNRLFNIQLPWSDSNVYWDTGNSGGYDRIGKAATEADFVGRWNHWAFTKDVASGTMKIYLNGTLWHSDIGKTKPMTGAVANACLGSGVGNNYYEGALDDVRIYNTVLPDSEIAALARTRPVANPGSVSVDEDASVAITLSGADANGSTSGLTYIVGVQPAHGTLSGTAPNLIYTPNANFFGSDRFYFIATAAETNSYAAEVSIAVNAIQDPPVAWSQDIIVRKDTSIEIKLAGTDADGESLTYKVSQPEHGSLSGSAPNLTYTPTNGYLGADRFTFIVNDGVEDSAPATVSIQVNQEVTEVIAAYDFDDGTGSASTGATLKDANVAAGDFGVGPGLNTIIDAGANSLSENWDAEGNIFGTANPLSFGGGRDALGFVRLASLATAIASNDYMTVTIAPANGYAMNLSRFTFRAWIENATESANSWALFSSVDGFQQANAIASGQTTAVGAWVGHVIDLSAARFQNLTGPVEFRLYIYNGRNNSGSTTLFDKVILHGLANVNYAGWVAGYGLSGLAALRTADVENGGAGDGFNNLVEYAFGMNPTNSEPHLPISVDAVVEQGTNWFELMHNRRQGYAVEGLRYLLIDSTNLVHSASFTNAQDQVRVGPVNDGYETVTNRYNASEPVRFIRLEVRQD